MFTENVLDSSESVYIIKKSWDEFKKFKTRAGFDFKTYFKGKSPEEVYQNYKKIVSAYMNIVYKIKKEHYDNYDPDYDGDNYETEFPIKESEAYIKALPRMRKMYNSANMMEKYVKKYSNKKYPFVDLGVLFDHEHIWESQADQFSEDTNTGVVWMPSSTFLQMAYPIGTLSSYDLKSVGYAKNRLDTGRIAPPSLQLMESGRKLRVAAHQGRHRNIANMVLNEEGEIPVLISYPADSEHLFQKFKKDIKAGLPVVDVVRPEDGGKRQDELLNGVYDRYHEANADSSHTYNEEKLYDKYVESQKPRSMNEKKFRNRNAMYVNALDHMETEPETHALVNPSVAFRSNPHKLEDVDFNSVLDEKWKAFENEKNKE